MMGIKAAAEISNRREEFGTDKSTGDDDSCLTSRSHQMVTKKHLKPLIQEGKTGDMSLVKKTELPVVRIIRRRSNYTDYDTSKFFINSPTWTPR
jgi:hypothetical protein